jgi:hypothetical protein
VAAFEEVNFSEFNELGAVVEVEGGEAYPG